MDFIREQDVFLLLPLLAGGIALYFFILKNTELWLWTSIAGHLAIYLQQSEKITPAEILLAIVFYPGLFLWFFRKMFLKKKWILGWEDFVFLLFAAYALFSIGIAAILNYKFLDGVRQYINYFVPLLFYFPVRDYVRTTGKGNLIIWLFILVASTVALVSIINYRLSIAVAQYLYEVWGTRKREVEPLFMCTILFLFSFFVSGRYKNYILFPLLLINIVALLITFSRMYWFGTVLSVFLFLILVHRNERRRLMQLLTAGTLLSVAGIVVLFPNIFTAIFEGLLLRIVRTDTRDLSFLSRLNESIAVLQMISQYPVTGHGLGSTISFYDVIIKETRITWYIHNAYLFLLCKFGIIGFVLFMTFYIKKLHRIYIGLMHHFTTGVYRNLFIAFFALLTVMLMINFTSPQFYEKRSILAFTLMWGVAEGLIENNRQSDNASIHFV